MIGHHALERLLADGIRPNAEAIGEIVLEGRVAVLMFEPSQLARTIASEMGWDGKAPVWKLSNKLAKAMAAVSRSTGDRVTARWLLREHGPGRIFVMMHVGTILVNFDGDGYWLEPGSTDAERKAVAS